MKKLFLAVLIFSLAFTCVFLNGCGKEPEKKPTQNEGKQESSQKPKEPKEIKDITKEIETVLQEAEKKQEMQENPNQSQEQESSQSQSGEGEGEGGGEGQQEGGKEGSQKDEIEDWAGEEKSVQSIHEKWNSLETQVVKAGAEDALIREFEDNLDNLTNQIMEKSIMGTQMAANELYGSIVKIADLFQTDNPPPANMMKYFTQKSLLAIEEDDWEDGKSNAQNLKKQWEKVKTMLNKNGAQLITQMDYAASDFEQSIDKKNKEVAKIKGEIVFSNIEKVIEELKKSKEK